MGKTNLTAISPIDGRYAAKVAELRPIFSELGLIYFRVLVEIHWLLRLSETAEIKEVSTLSIHHRNRLINIVDNFNENDAARIKNIEDTTNHDVKAVEYFIREKFAGNIELEAISEFVHFACTSEDINNLAYALMLKTARSQCLLLRLDEIINALTKFAHDYADTAMLARTHGQAATPTTVGKEMSNFVARLKRQRSQFASTIIQGKFNGATGNYNAHVVAYPDIDWPALCQSFVESLGLHWTSYTTQIEPHDAIAEYLQNLIRINTVLIDFNRDIWGYISLNYFRQKAIGSETGSSTMPHKVNPIDFENSEGNLSLANALMSFLAERLPVSRWQRDLVDSTLLRNLGVAVAHSLVGYQSLLKGLRKLEINPAKLTEDLNNNWQVLAEPIQTIMRRHGINNAYEKLKAFSRGKPIDEQAIKAFIHALTLPDSAKQQLLALTPEAYIGLAKMLAMTVDQ